MEQGSKEWLDWRRRGLGGSDAPIIMGVSPWKTPLELWKEKTGRAERNGGTGPNWAQQRGIDMEPKARAKYELLEGLDAPPILFEHPDYPHFRVSLDGWNEEKQIVLEIKCPGRDDHAKAKSGEVPLKYIWQLEMQLWVTGGKEAHYFSYYEGKDGKSDYVLIKYRSDLERRERLIKALHHFWDCVVRDIPPELSDKDSMALEDANARAIFKRLGELERDLAAADEQIAVLKEARDALKEEASKFCTHSRVVCEGVELIKRTRKGRIDYAKVPSLTGVDLESFRTPDVTYYEVKLVV